MLELFHVTYFGRLGAIASRGLVAGASRSIGARSLDFHAKRGVFLSDGDGVDFWFERAQEFAEHNSDDVLADGLVAVVLRVTLEDGASLVPDEVANQEGSSRFFDNWISTEAVDPDDIEVWSGSDWLDVEDWSDLDPELGVEWEDDEDSDGGGYWLTILDSPLLPPDDARKGSFVGNDFQAEPRSFAGPVTTGVAEYPGFHTAELPEITYAYAQLKAVGYREGYPDELEELDLPLDDYPVVVALDMSGMKALTDYDAVKMVRPAVESVAKEAVSWREDDPIEELREYVEQGDYGSRGMPATSMEWLFEAGAPVMLDPAASLLDFAEAQDDPNGFLRSVAEGSISDEALAAITGQFRYLEDVPLSRVVEVTYVKPWWPRILSDEGDDEELIDAVEGAGWQVFAEDDVMSGQLPSTGRPVYESSSRPKSRAPARIEYHGTSYQNLVAAFPEFPWPVPPAPYVR